MQEAAAEIERLRAVIEQNAGIYQAEFEKQAAEIERLRLALRAVTQCDDDGYGPEGYCINIAEAALGDGGNQPPPDATLQAGTR